MGDFFQIGKMAVEQGTSDCQKVRVTGIVNLNDSPRILSCPNTSSSNLDDLF
jgi:hypothetical protein